jgi:hypothetical protein
MMASMVIRGTVLRFVGYYSQTSALYQISPDTCVCESVQLGASGSRYGTDTFLRIHMLPKAQSCTLCWIHVE